MRVHVCSLLRARAGAAEQERFLRVRTRYLNTPTTLRLSSPSIYRQKRRNTCVIRHFACIFLVSGEA